MADVPVVPVLSGGESETVRTERVEGIGGPIADVARAPRVTVRDALATARDEGFDALRETPVRDLLASLREASLRFEGVGIPESPPAESYHERVARATGLPVGWVRVSAHWLSHGLRHAAEALRAQSPTGDLDVYDDPAYTRERDVGLAFAPRVRVLGATMPANDPAVYAWPALALAMKVPVVLRPSDRDPFTAVRLARALLAAGVPESAVHVLPAERAVGQTVCRDADHALLFGGEDAVAPFRDDPSVETYGPGNSVAVVARDPTDRELDTLARGVVRAGGRACVNLSRVVATGDCDPDALVDGLARRVADARVGPVDDPATDVALFPDADRADDVDSRADAAGADVAARHRASPRRVEVADAVALRPTVVRSADLVAELPFPFAGVTYRERDALPARLDRAYLAVCVGDEALERALVRTPRVRNVYGGRYPAAVDLRETHETYLASFLYETTTYDPR